MENVESANALAFSFSSLRGGGRFGFVFDGGASAFISSVALIAAYRLLSVEEVVRHVDDVSLRTLPPLTCLPRLGAGLRICSFFLFLVGSVLGIR